MVMAAAGTIAPVSSVTDPRIVAVLICPIPEEQISMRQPISAVAVRRVTISSPPSYG
jgi:hypothetical protein